MDDLDLALLIFLEDEQSSEDDTERLEASDIFKRRATEGAYEILVRRHLHYNEDKFREYFRLTPVLFDYVLNYIKGYLTSKSYNRNKNPISPEQKLCIFKVLGHRRVIQITFFPISNMPFLDKCHNKTSC